MKKKIISVILCAAMSAAMLSGCGQAAENQDAAETAAETESQEMAEPAAESEEAAEPAAESQEAAEPAAEESSEDDKAYVQANGKLVVGITDFEPMDYKDENGDWIGFDADMAKAFAESLGVEVEFMEIDWDNKTLELDGKTIDCVWNGMTLTDEVTSSMECSKAYCDNAQIVVVKADKAEDYATEESLADLNFAVEAGSAGEAAVTERGLNATPVKAQSDALMEVAAGTSDAAVIDSLMAAAMVGEGTGYEDLTCTVKLTTEEYGVGFRKGSNLAAALDEFLAAAAADGSLMETAEKYGVQAAVIQ